MIDPRCIPEDEALRGAILTHVPECLCYDRSPCPNRKIYSSRFGPHGISCECRNNEKYITGTGQTIFTHKKNINCENDGCVIHNPSNHSMKEFKTHWRSDRALMERLCQHGIGHPDPDHLSFVRRTRGVDAAKTESIHGCDSCCRLEVEMSGKMVSILKSELDRLEKNDKYAEKLHDEFVQFQKTLGKVGKDDPHFLETMVKNGLYDAYEKVVDVL